MSHLFAEDIINFKCSTRLGVCLKTKNKLYML